MRENEERDHSSDILFDFVYGQCDKAIKEPEKKLSFFGQIEFVKKFCYLRYRLNASGGSEAAVTARTRIERMKTLCHNCKFVRSSRVIVHLKIKHHVWQPSFDQPL